MVRKLLFVNFWTRTFFLDLSKKSEKLSEFHKKTLRRGYLIISVYFFLVPLALLNYFYAPIAIDIVKLVVGRTDLQYPLVLKADYVFFDPRRDNTTFVVYTVVSRTFINIFLYGFYIMDLFLVTLFFYVSTFMESVKLQMRHLSEDEVNEATFFAELKYVIDNHVNAIRTVKLLDFVTRNIMLTQLVLFSISFCFILFNFTQVDLNATIAAKVSLKFNFQIVESRLLLFICVGLTVVTQFGQFVFSFYASKIQSEVKHTNSRELNQSIW